MTKGEYDSRIQTSCLAILTIVTIAVTLYLLRAVLVPFILAAFLTLILLPIVDFLIRKLRIGRPIALVATLFLGFLVMFGMGVLVVSSAQQFSNNSSQYEERLAQLVEKAEGYIANSPIMDFISAQEPGETDDSIDPGDSVETVAPIESAQVDTAANSDMDEESDTVAAASESVEGQNTFDITSLLPKEGFQGIAKSISNSVLSLAQNVVLVMLFTAFLLAGSATRTKPREGVLGEIESRVQKYIGIKIVLSMLTGTLVYIILRLVGVDYALSFGAFAFILNFVPNVGSAIATLLPVPVVLLAPDVTVMMVILAIGLPGVIQFVIGNVIEPRIMGDTLGLHPIVILMALIFWGMLWGVAGVLLAAPMTAIAKIVFARIEVTKPLAGLMEGRLETLDEM